MVPLCLTLVVTIIATVGITSKPETAIAATLQTADQAAKVVSLQNVRDKDGEVAGEVVNNSKQTLRDVQLQILYSWRWKNEFRPGTDDPGRAVYYMIDKEIPPGQSARFVYKPSPPFSSRGDGYFEITVSVVGFAQVYR